MEIIEITAEEYDALVDEDIPVFCKKDFLELNSAKVDQVHYMLGRDSKNRIALAIGEKNGEWSAPFSAPFSNIVLLRKDTSIECIWTYVEMLVEYIRERNGKSITLYLPADVYGAQENARLYNALLGNGFTIEFEDVNYSFDLKSFDMESYKGIMHYNARKNLKIALKSDNVFLRCETDEEKAEAYDIIKVNREQKGYPLRMTKNQLMETIKVVAHDFFLVKNQNRTIAAAVVYRLNDKIAQVVYWGDIPDVGQYKPINFIAYNLVKYYKELDYEVLDVGISTEKGKPNYGLCSFKESLGCIPSSKCQFRIEL